MPLTDSEFQLRCDAAMHDLNKALLVAADRWDFEPDFQAGALKIEFEDPPEKYVVSPNAPVHQIWVSARVKSYKLDWDLAREAFVFPSTGQDLKALISDLIGQRVGESVPL
jgi:iron donor protein CyaY